MNTRIWDAMSIADSVKMKNISFHHLVNGRSGRCPFIVRSSHLHKVLHEFTDLKHAVSASQILIQHIIYTYLIVIDSDDLGVISSSKLEQWDQAEYLRNGRSDHENIATACANISKLYVELLVVMVEESASSCGVYSIEGDHFGRCEETVENKTYDTS
jgi:hypothetical protein